MKNISIIIPVILTILSLGVYAGSKAPEKTHGLSPKVLHQNNLGAQIEVMKGYDVRARRISFAAGGATAEHSHASRPGIVYVEKGEIIEYRNGEKRTFKKGDTWIETADTNHWVKNASMSEEAAIIMIDLPAKE